VYFLPRAFLDLPLSVVDSLTAYRSSAIVALLAELTVADRLTSDAYTRFRFVWLLTRDGTVPTSADDLCHLTRHTNLFAPIITHDHKSFVQKVIQKLMPTADDCSGATSAAKSAASFRARLQHRNGAGLLPQLPFACDITDPHAMLLELLQTMVHAQTCAAKDWNLDARTWTISQEDSTCWIAAFQQAWTASCAAVLSWLKIHLDQRGQYVDFVVRCYRELLPPKTLVQVLESCFPFDWLDPAFQQGLVRHVMHDSLAMKYPPSIDHRYEFWQTISSAIESHRCLEVQSEILTLVQELTREKSRADHTHPLTSHWTVTYRDDGINVDPPSAVESMQTCTLRLESGFSSTTGCSLWPAGMLMCEFILANRHIFAGKRVLELGVGIGLTSQSRQQPRHAAHASADLSCCGASY
jgi:hypothetical protein